MVDGFVDDGSPFVAREIRSSRTAGTPGAFVEARSFRIGWRSFWDKSAVDAGPLVRAWE